jgi:alanine racemase
MSMIPALPLTWLEINKRALFHNLASFKELIGPTAMLAPVVKSNAYGHGLIPIATLCEQNEYVAWLCVLSLSEAVTLRLQGIKKPILVLSVLDLPVAEAIIYDIDFTIYSMDALTQAETEGRRLKKAARIHVKVDTGLSRLGLLPAAAFSLIEHAQRLPHVEIRGVFTHLSDAESAEPSYCKVQLQRFKDFTQALDKAGIPIPFKHVSCTAAASTFMRNQTEHLIARCGLGIYGLWPTPLLKQKTVKYLTHGDIEPVLTWKTRIIHLNTVPAHSFIGYDCTYQTTTPTLIATLPVGYWDGLDRELSNKASVIINDHVAPIRGRIAMNLCMVDVTHIPKVKVGDIATILGNHPLISAEAHAAWANTINYEIVTRINPLLPRIIV